MASKIVKKVKPPVKTGAKVSAKARPSPVRGGGTSPAGNGGATGAFGLLSGEMGSKRR